ncbi:MFS transporter (plasmid) [Sphingomonas panni]|jgi:MFS family permease|uniref:MFS transporter n=1 Tax=Sphingomonas floccifaciens TaxID=1844115 RepID=A0ABW4NGE1_9SPHN|nr:MFS transporter [Sphingomonas sp. TDK1]OAN64964.1 arabinose ABC transporter permease [Sphingomonas sp. TDK1]
MVANTLDRANSTPLERDARLINAREHEVRPADIAVGVIIGRSTEFFDFFVYAIASVLVFPSLIFPNVSALQGTIYSFAIFALAFVARPFGAFAFLWLDRRHGRGVKLTIAMFLLGGSTAAMAFLPSYGQVGGMAAVLLALFRIGQGVAQGGTWDGLPALLSLNAPANRRGWFAMIPQLGAPIGLFVAAAVFAFLLTTLKPADFLDWGWRYPFFVAFVINVVALFARLRLISTPEFEELFDSRELQPSPVGQMFREEGRTVILGAFAPLASFALFHLVTVFPLSWVVLTSGETATHFLVIEMVGAAVGLVAVAASGIVADRIGRRTLLGISAAMIGAYSGFAPQLLGRGPAGEWVYMLLGFVLLGLSFGQSSGATNSSFSARHRYTGAGTTATASWFIGAAFAPLAALLLASNFGLISVGAYLLSGAACTLGALALNREWGRRSA